MAAKKKAAAKKAPAKKKAAKKAAPAKKKAAKPAARKVSAKDAGVVATMASLVSDPALRKAILALVK